MLHLLIYLSSSITWYSFFNHYPFNQLSSSFINSPFFILLSFITLFSPFIHSSFIHSIIHSFFLPQLIGYNDEILDMKYMGFEDETHVAVVTNSEYVKVFEVDTWDCQVLTGHTDIVLCADVYEQGSLLVTSSKVRICF